MSLFEELDLAKYGISGAAEIVHNPSYETLFAEETKSGLEGYDKGFQTEMGAVDVMTGVYTGRSPKDKFIVKDDRILSGGQPTSSRMITSLYQQSLGMS